MPKYYGKIGFSETVETRPGIWEEQIVERDYYGDVLKISKRFDGSSYLNDNLNISNQFSIVADPYARDHFHSMRYLTWCGTKWKISSVQVDYPRLSLEVGGLYNDGQ